MTPVEPTKTVLRLHIETPSDEGGHFFGIGYSLRSRARIRIPAIDNHRLAYTASKMQSIELHGRRGKTVHCEDACDRSGFRGDDQRQVENRGFFNAAMNPRRHKTQGRGHTDATGSHDGSLASN